MGTNNILIRGKVVLQGEVQLSGAKNAALPMIVAACLGEESTTLENVPTQLNDIQAEISLLRAMGASVSVNGNSVKCSRGDLSSGTAPADLVGKIRSSLLLLGLYSALELSLELPLPGGDKIGDRKHDLHIMGLRKLGAQIEEHSEKIVLGQNALSGSQIDFYLPTTSGTENIMLAGVLAKGRTLLRNANTRPEIQQLGSLLTAMGGKVKVQSRIVEIEGVSHLRGGAHFTIMPGWDEAVTYMIAAGMTGGEIAIREFDLSPAKEEARYLREAGIGLFEWQGNVYVSGRGERSPFDLFTAPYPGVNSDMQPLFAALALTISGISTITDLRFTDRFQYVKELRRFGGQIPFVNILGDEIIYRLLHSQWET